MDEGSWARKTTREARRALAYPIGAIAVGALVLLALPTEGAGVRLVFGFVIPVSGVACGYFLMDERWPSRVDGASLRPWRRSHLQLLMGKTPASYPLDGARIEKVEIAEPRSPAQTAWIYVVVRFGDGRSLSFSTLVPWEIPLLRAILEWAGDVPSFKRSPELDTAMARVRVGMEAEESLRKGGAANVRLTGP